MGTETLELPQQKADCFNNLFAEKATVPEPDREPPVMDSEPCPHSLEHIRFNSKVVRRKLQLLQTCKSTGADNIPASPETLRS